MRFMFFVWLIVGVVLGNLAVDVLTGVVAQPVRERHMFLVWLSTSPADNAPQLQVAFRDFATKTKCDAFRDDLEQHLRAPFNRKTVICVPQ